MTRSMIDFEIITIFPDLIEAVAPYGVVGRAGLVSLAPVSSGLAAGSAESASAPAQASVSANTEGSALVAAMAAGSGSSMAELEVSAAGSLVGGRSSTIPDAPGPARSGDGARATKAVSPRYRLRCWNPRDFTFDNYRRIDDHPYGGGPGMVMLAEPLLRCLAAIRQTRGQEGRPALPLIHLSPQGKPFHQGRARQLAESPGAILLCGRYEAIDQRFLDAEVDEEISMGDFVVSGGELPAMLLLDAVVRLLPGVLNHEDSAVQDSFDGGVLDCPHYTRPEHLPGLARGVPPGVPPVLLSGNHREIERWRAARALEATERKRPDLLARAETARGARTPD